MSNVYTIRIDGFIDKKVVGPKDAVLTLYSMVKDLNKILAYKYNLPVEAIKSIDKEERFRPHYKTKVTKKIVERVCELHTEYRFNNYKIAKLVKLPVKYVDNILVGALNYPPTKETYAKLDALRTGYIESNATIRDISKTTKIDSLSTNVIIRTMVLTDRINEDVIPNKEMRQAIRNDRAKFPKTIKAISEFFDIPRATVSKYLHSTGEFVSKLDRDRSLVIDVLRKCREGFIKGLRKFRNLYQNMTKKAKDFFKNAKGFDNVKNFFKKLFG